MATQIKTAEIQSWRNVKRIVKVNIHIVFGEYRWKA